MKKNLLEKNSDGIDHSEGLQIDNNERFENLQDLNLSVFEVKEDKTLIQLKLSKNKSRGNWENYVHFAKKSLNSILWDDCGK